MHVHIFRGPGRVFGFTQLESGDNLPPHFAPWTAFKTIALTRDGEPVPGVNTIECLDDIEAHGFHLTDAHKRITDQAI